MLVPNTYAPILFSQRRGVLGTTGSDRVQRVLSKPMVSGLGGLQLLLKISGQLYRETARQSGFPANQLQCVAVVAVLAALDESPSTSIFVATDASIGSTLDPNGHAREPDPAKTQVCGAHRGISARS